MKKESSLLTFIKGFIIGLGIIFPISASSLAISMGMYEKLLKIVSNIKKSIKKEFKFILFFALGVVVSAIVSCVLINYTYEKFPIATLLFFIGLIIGGIPLIFKKTNKEYKISNFLMTIIGIVLLISLSFLSGNTHEAISISFTSLLILFFVGLISAGAMIIPGVSGSIVLVILGYYDTMLQVITDIVSFNDLLSNIIIALVFGIGMITGVLIVSKLMNYFLEKYETKTYFAIVGFVIASIINVSILLFSFNFNIIEFIVGIMLFIIGFLISFKYMKEE